MPFPVELAMLAALGVVSGFINIVAGGGSFLVLPVLIFLGLPPAMANGTNRVGILAQNISGVIGFHGHGLFRWRSDLFLCAPALAGAALGAWAALALPEVAFTRLLSLAMVAVTLWALMKGAGPEDGGPDARAGSRLVRHSGPWGRDGGESGVGSRKNLDSASTRWAVPAGFFLIGVYGGLIQAGIGFFVLAITSMGGENLLRGNALKVLSVLLITVLTLAIFAGADQVDWPRGLALGVGNAIGGAWGVRLAVLRGHAWLQRVVTVTIIVFAVLLWFS